MTRSSGEIGFEHLLRELAPQVLGAVIRRFHDFAAAEDAVQEAMLAAVLQWQRDGVPENPRGWADDRRDRPRVPGPGSDYGAAPSCAVQ